jgi:hypothetical protein
VAWEGGPVGGSAGESMEGGNDEVVTWRDGVTPERRGDAEALTRAETLGPTSLLQREKDRKRGWGTGGTEGVGGAGLVLVLVAWGSGLVVGGADESMEGRDDELGRRGRRRGGATWGCGSAHRSRDACPRVPSPEGEGQEEGMGNRQVGGGWWCWG